MTEPVPAPPEQQVGVLGAVAFLVELVMFALLAVAGWRLGPSTPVSVVLAVVLVVLVGAVWGRWLAPRSGQRLSSTPRAVAAAGLFLATAALAVAAGVSWLVAVPFLVIGAAVFVATRDA